MKFPTALLRFKAPIALGLLMLLPACSDRNNPSSSAPPRAPMDISPRISVGEIKAGMTVDKVTAALGEPDRRTANAVEYTQRGFAVMPGQGVVQIVLCGDVTGLHGPLVAAFQGKTREGIGLTSTRDEVLKAYGQPDSKQTFVGGRESMRYDSLGITFSLEGGKVHHMIVRLTGDSEPERSIEIKP